MKTLIKLKRDIKINFDSWSVLSLIFVSLISMPILNILTNIFNERNENWDHIMENLMGEYLKNSFLIVGGTAIITITLGVGLAWLLAAYSFPMSNFFEWSLILPLAIPSYVAGYTYVGLLSYTGVIQSYLRNSGVEVSQSMLDLMNLKGAVFIFSMTLFPYIFIIVKGFLTRQSAGLVEASKSLGKSDIETFFKVIVPISRGAIVGGVSLVILEVLNDYGLVSYFGIPTFSTGIFRTWLSIGDLDSAIKLAAVLMFIVFFVLFVEKMTTRRRSFSFSSTKIRPLKKIKLKGAKGTAATIVCFSIFSISFLIPFIQLLHWTVLTYKKILSLEFIELILNSFFLSALSSVAIIFTAVIIANNARIRKNNFTRFCSKMANSGYSIPGAVVSIGVMIFFIYLDKNMFKSVYEFMGIDKTLVISSSLCMLGFAYLVRFFSIGYNSVETGFEKVGKSFFEASKSLGFSTTKTFFKVDLKMLKPSILGAFILVFIDILKELPLTLILRPFNFHTLATRAYQYANDERIHEASLSSVLIILIGSLSIYFLNRWGKRKEA